MRALPRVRVGIGPLRCLLMLAFFALGSPWINASSGTTSDPFRCGDRHRHARSREISGPLRLKMFSACCGRLRQRQSPNRSISAIDEHVVDYAEQSSTTRDHLMTDHVRHPRQVLELSQSCSFVLMQQRHCIRSDRIHGGTRNHLPCSCELWTIASNYDDDKASDAHAVHVAPQFPQNFPEALRRFHVDDSAPI